MEDKFLVFSYKLNKFFLFPVLFFLFLVNTEPKGLNHNPTKTLQIVHIGMAKCTVVIAFPLPLFKHLKK